MIHSVISDSQDLARGYRIIDGYVFTSIDEPHNVFDAIVIRCPEHCDCWTPKKPFSSHTLSEHIQYIRERRLEKAMVIAESLDFLRECPTLKGLWIKPADTAPENFDYRPIHHLSPSYLFCETHYDSLEGLSFGLSASLRPGHHGRYNCKQRQSHGHCLGDGGTGEGILRLARGTGGGTDLLDGT